jgi:ubiquinone/menaquinone biosynthesis C-methylase UbiE
LCEEPPVFLDQAGRRYLGYEYVGENYEGVKQGIIDDDYGIFGGSTRELVRLLGKGCVVLDLGAGLSPSSITLAMAGADTIAVDISQKMLSTAALRAARKPTDGRLVFARMNAYNLAISNSSVNAVVANDVLHQLDNPEAAMKEITRVLKPGGVFVEYSSVGLLLTQEQREINRKCSEAFSDIQSYYYSALTRNGYAGPPFSSWDEVKANMAKYFECPNCCEPIMMGYGPRRCSKVSAS